VLYGCNDVGYDSGNSCNSSGQGCGEVAPAVTVRQPAVGEGQCSGPTEGDIPCGGYQYCQEAACYCPSSVSWDNCGSTAYALVGTNNAIEAERWKNRVNNVVNFIQTYNLDKVVDVQTFLNQTNSSANIDSAWSTYVTGCALPTWSAPQPGNCDVKAANACQQATVCAPWESSNTYSWKQEIVQYPSGNQSSCCPANSSWYAGCCCPDTDAGATSCADVKGCTPVNGALSKTWCQA